MKTILKLVALAAVVSAAVVAVIAYKDEIASLIEKGVEKFKAICPCSEDTSCFADIDE